jgi:hypothetical protein
LALLVVAAGCGSDHHVSPWPKDVSLQSLMRASTMEEHLERVAAEMQVEGLALEHEVCGELEESETFCIRAYRGHDDLGSQRRAVRVATRYGVVMALGPTSSHDAMRGVEVALVPSLEEGWKSGSDLNGDGMPDVVVARSGGALEVWGLHARGASPYPIDALVPVTGAMDVDGDGRPDLMGTVSVPPGEALVPSLVEVVSFAGGRYRYDTPSVRAFHAQRAREIAGDRSGAAHVARAWHALRSGKDPAKVMKALDDVIDGVDDRSAEERAALRRWRNWLASAITTD